MRTFTGHIAVLALLIGLAATASSAKAQSGLIISGTTRDSVTQTPLKDVCVTLGPPIRCWFVAGQPNGLHTDAAGNFSFELPEGTAPGGTWDLYFVCDAQCVATNPSGYQTAYSGKFIVSGPYSVGNILMVKSPTPPPPPPPGGGCVAASTATPTSTVYLPNITRLLGGPSGWNTPFIIQNTGATGANLEVSFYKFSDGACVSRLNVTGLQAGTSYSNDPADNGKNPTLPNDAQFSVVVKSFGASIVGVVNEVQGSGSRFEAMSYNGFTAGATTVNLPNITRQFFGYNTPFIIQNLGTSTVTATATFRPFDGSSGPIQFARTINPGGAKPIDTSSNDPLLGAPGLADGKQYSVTVTGSQPLAVVVNTVNDAPSVAAPVAFATDGVTGGASVVYGAYAAKNAQGVGRFSPIVVQNLGSTAVTPTLTLTPITGAAGTASTYTFPSIAPNSSKAFDPRFSFDTQGTTNVPCSVASATCLGDGEYVVKIDGGSGASLAAQVNIVSNVTAMGYAASATAASKFYLPNITKSLCFCPSPTPTTGWTTPIVLQSVTATAATLRWYRFSDGALVTTQNVTLTSGGGLRVDPWSVAQLPADQQYAVVVDAAGSLITAIVTEFGPAGGDNAMAYEGFPSP
jgi:hypothetical protein